MADIRLIFEIADSSLKYDRLTNAALYAFTDMPEYWIVNLNEGRLEVYREPYGSTYTYTSSVAAARVVAV